MIFAHYTLGFLSAALVDLDQARLHVETALVIAQAVKSSYWSPLLFAVLAEVRLHAGDLDGAEAALSAVLHEDTPMRTLVHRMAWFARAQVTLARGQPERTLAIVESLIAAATPDAERDLIRLPNLARLRGEALAATGRLDEAHVCFEAARNGAMARGDLSLLWRVHLSRAALFRGLGRREQVASEIGAAHEALAAMAAGLTDPSLRDPFLRRAAAFLPPVRPPTARRLSMEQFGGLTARERSVAALVAAGHSNREIAEALFVTERTAETHVGNIMSKLGVKTRAQIAAWAQERGLTGTPDA
jgi:DNA-binding CsgD family transcriptional regulator